jgi:hypothetical protein
MHISPVVALLLFIFVISLFFWGIYKLVKTQEKFYLIALLPFVALLFAMFFIE